jgi:uncharacterized membrane protein YtjA (UPF0391 family)
MLRLAVLFLVIALIAGALFGAGNLEGAAFEAARLCFIVFIVLAILSFFGGAFRGSRVGDL